jgi:signal transduction histidine kinase
MRIPLPVKIVISAFAPVFLALWIVAEAGRDIAASTTLAALIAVTIGLAGWFPRVALAIGCGTLVLQLVGLVPSFAATDWPIVFGLLVPVVAAAYTAAGARSLVVVVSLILTGSLVLGLGLGLGIGGWATWHLADVAFRGYSPGSWGEWTGNADASLTERVATSLQIALSSAVLAGIAALVAAGLAAILRSGSDRVALVRVEADLKDAHLEQTIIGERARIARDVHDAMAHSLAIVIAQADGALASGAGDDADAALSTIAETARRALTDVRDVLERIDGDGPALGARDLPALIETVGSTGLDVRMSISGEPDAVPTVVSLAAYRIVQEALTNTLRHTATPAVADVTIDWRGAGAVIVVASSGVPREDSAGAGRGIAGMSERARLLGGWLSAGRSGDEFVVTATLPYPASNVDTADELDEALA